MAKPRQKSMRKAYLRRFSSTMINGGHTVNAIGLKKLYYDKDINPNTPLPNRRQLNKHTPTMTEPMKERVESWRVAIKNKPTDFILIHVNTPFIKLSEHYDGHSDRSVHYFVEINYISNSTKISFTLSRATALRIRENGLKGIPWKDV